jgi:D-xylose transport system substrate-binding protein
MAQIGSNGNILLGGKMVPNKNRVKALVAVMSLGAASLVGSAVVPTAASAATLKNVKIAFLLPQNGVPRFEQLDKPSFVKQIKKLCPTCTVLNYNAQNEDAARQQQQAEAALAAGAKILVMIPVDGVAAKVIADKAAKQGVPVIAYERLIMGSKNVKAYVTHDGVKIGEMQAQSLIERSKALGIQKKPVLMVNGSITTSDAALFKKGAEKAFKAAGVTILDEFDTPGWDPAKAQAQMDQWITKYGNDGFGAVYAANGGTAGGVIASMKAAGIDPSKHPVSGQDADTSEAQRILAGEQYMTIFRPLKQAAAFAASAAWAVLNKQVLSKTVYKTTSNNGAWNVPTLIDPAITITKANIQKVMIDGGYTTAAAICTDAYKAACAANGIK